MKRNNERREEYMRRCITVACTGYGTVEPNPYVGAVIVHNGSIVACGAHEHFGGPHAEVNAIQDALARGIPLKESILYVNLEPCCHHGKTPPCTELIMQHHIPEVVVGMQDPFPQVSGKGIGQLRQAGIRVHAGVLSNECMELNRRFITYHTQERPHVILKWAQTRDGFIARTDGSCQWISNEKSRALVHHWRSQESAIMVGTKTAQIDNPRLTARVPGARQPLRVVIDRDLQLDRSLNLFDESAESIVITEKAPSKERQAAKSISYLSLPFDAQFVATLLAELRKRGVFSILVEGGAQLLKSFHQSNLWDEARVFVGQMDFGAGLPAPKLPDTLRVEPLSLLLGSANKDEETQLDGDQLITYRNVR